MPEALSMEFRKAVARSYDECNWSAEVAEQMGCCEAFVRRLIQNRRERGTLEPRPARRPDTGKLDEGGLVALEGIIRRDNDPTLGELAEEPRNHRGKRLSVPTVWRATQRLGLPRAVTCTNERLTPNRSATSARVSTHSSPSGAERRLQVCDRASIAHLRRQ